VFRLPNVCAAATTGLPLRRVWFAPAAATLHRCSGGKPPGYPLRRVCPAAAGQTTPSSKRAHQNLALKIVLLPKQLRRGALVVAKVVARLRRGELQQGCLLIS